MSEIYYDANLQFFHKFRGLFLIFFIIFSFLFPSKIYAYNTIIKDQNNSKILIVGDSRVVGITKSSGNTNISCIAKVRVGYDWLQTTASTYIDDFARRNMFLIFMIGVNDLGNSDKYVEFINANKQKWEAEEFTVCFAAVGPVIEGEHNATVEGVNMFNSKLKKNLNNLYWLDINSYLLKKGFNAPDGIHYDAATYDKITDYLKIYVEKARLAQ